MAQTKRTISDDIHALGDLLGQTLKTHEGEATYELVEQIRTLAKSARTSEQDAQTLRQTHTRLAVKPSQRTRTRQKRRYMYTIPAHTS